METQNKLKKQIKRLHEEWMKIANTVSQKKADDLLFKISAYAKSVNLDEYLDSLIIKELKKSYKQ
jgi:hypothetical protein